MHAYMYVMYVYAYTNIYNSIFLENCYVYKKNIRKNIRDTNSNPNFLVLTFVTYEL